jgi:hypothetical protein
MSSPKIEHPSKSAISGDFPVKCKIELVLEKISGGFPLIQSKFPHF